MLDRNNLFFGYSCDWEINFSTKHVAFHPSCLEEPSNGLLVKSLMPSMSYFETSLVIVPPPLSKELEAVFTHGESLGFFQTAFLRQLFFSSFQISRQR